MCGLMFGSVEDKIFEEKRWLECDIITFKSISVLCFLWKYLFLIAKFATCVCVDLLQAIDNETVSYRKMNVKELE